MYQPFFFIHPDYIKEKLRQLRNFKTYIEYVKDFFEEDQDQINLRCDLLFPRDNPNFDFYYEFLGGKCVLFDRKKAQITCGWQLVRRVKAGNKWHPKNDNLEGKFKYGVFQDDVEADATFSRKWKNKDYTQFLFSTGGFEKWMVMSREAVGGNAVEPNGAKRRLEN